MNDIFIGRQPIYDQSLNVVAYELLYRSNFDSNANVINGDNATQEVAINMMMEIGLHKLIGNKLGFINYTRNLIVDRNLILPSRNIAIEILEDVIIDEEIINSIKKLKEEGFRIVLDDVVNIDYIMPLINLADIAKIDILSIDKSLLKEIAAKLKKHNIKLLAEKVETYEQFEIYKAMDFEYFQGNFLCSAKTITLKKLPESRLIILRLFSQLCDPNVSFSAIKEIIKSDVSLSFKLLNLLNSAYYSTRYKITSIKQALLMLGLNNMKSWISIYLLSTMNDKPSNLMLMSATRAKMCELIAKACGYRHPENFFMVGLFSLLDAMLDRSLDNVISHMSLSENTVRGILDFEGDMGMALKCAVLFEQGIWNDLYKLDIDNNIIEKSYLKSIAWVDSMKALIS